MTIISDRKGLTVDDFKNFKVINPFFITENSNQRFYALIEDHKVIGCITYTSNSTEYTPEAAYVLRLEILKDYRNKGLGTGLTMLAIQDIFSSMNATMVIVRPAKKAVGFYHKLGFEPLAQSPNLLYFSKSWVQSRPTKHYIFL